MWWDVREKQQRATKSAGTCGFLLGTGELWQVREQGRWQGGHFCSGCAVLGEGQVAEDVPLPA